MEFRNTDFKSPEQTVQQSGKTVKFNKTQRWLILPTFRLSSRARNRVADGIHISVITRCKSVVRLYQQSAIRSKRKIGLRQVRRKFREVALTEKARTDAGPDLFQHCISRSGRNVGLFFLAVRIDVERTGDTADDLVGNDDLAHAFQRRQFEHGV